MGYTGIIFSAELCSPLEKVQLQLFLKNKVISETFSDRNGRWNLPDNLIWDRLDFSLKGFVTKTYSKKEELPQVVRLLEDKLIGYQEKLWFNPGEKINLYVHSPSRYNAKVYRHGFSKDNILDLGINQPQLQQVPDNFFVGSGLAWIPTTTYKLPYRINPGLYSVLLEAEGQEPFAVPFIVSTPKEGFGKNTKLLVLASTNTWQSYNIWGGRSRYRNFEDNYSPDFIWSSDIRGSLSKILRGILPMPLFNILKRSFGKGKDVQEWMFDRLSIRRPFTNCALEDNSALNPFTNHLAGGEWRILAWLEREHIKYDIISGYELYDKPDILAHYKALLLSTHSEYWSAEMFEAVKKYHTNNGLWIINISGNSIFREIDFFEDGSTKCSSLSFEKSYADETEMLGVRFSMSDYGTCAPYKMMRPSHWTFQNIITKDENLFGFKSLNQNTQASSSRYDPGRPGIKKGLMGHGASGWETDKLSNTAPTDFIVIAKGTNKNGGADMVIREPKAQRGGVFSASSILFGGALLIDDVCSTLTKNIINRSLSNNENK